MPASGSELPNWNPSGINATKPGITPGYGVVTRCGASSTHLFSPGISGIHFMSNTND
jgi:hypothetical protein